MSTTATDFGMYMAKIQKVILKGNKRLRFNTRSVKPSRGGKIINLSPPDSPKKEIQFSPKVMSPNNGIF